MKNWVKNTCGRHEECRGENLFQVTREMVIAKIANILNFKIFKQEIETGKLSLHLLSSTNVPRDFWQICKEAFHWMSKPRRRIGFPLLFLILYNKQLPASLRWLSRYLSWNSPKKKNSLKCRYLPCKHCYSVWFKDHVSV